MTAKFDVGNLTVFVKHSEEYFNSVCRATIPGYWEAEIDMTEDLLDHFEANNDFSHLRIYGTSQDSAQDALQDLVEELQKSNLTGVLKIRKQLNR